MSEVTPPTVEEVLSWPVTVPAIKGARCWRLGRRVAYQLARENRLPFPVLRYGRRLVATRASILRALEIADPDNSLTTDAFPQLDGTASDVRSADEKAS